MTSFLAALGGLSNNNSGGVFSLLLNAAVLSTFDTASITANEIERSQLTASTNVSAGIYSIGIQIIRPFNGTATSPQ